MLTSPNSAMYPCTKNPDTMTSCPCTRTCPYYWQCVANYEQAQKKKKEKDIGIIYVNEWEK